MKTMMILASLLAALLTSSARAHVSLEPKTALGGSYQTLSFRAGHGCAGSATTAITIVLPEAITGAKPMPKPGWTLSTGSREIAWRGGPLPDSQFDEFKLLVKLPDGAGKQVFKVLQRCEQGSADWIELPGVAGSHPAPVLEILPASAPPSGADVIAPGAVHHH
jgi:uncharacterized protein YcnI